MKTIEELYKEINASEELQKAVSEIEDKAAMDDFLKMHGCEASAEEFAKYIASQYEGEIEDDDAEAAAGGRRYNPDKLPGWLKKVADVFGDHHRLPILF